MSQLEIIHENKAFIVVNKSAGLISEKSRYENITVEDQVYEYLLKNKPKPYVGVIHRLDRVTSGTLIFAKKKSILVQFNELFQQRKVQKTYLAIVKNQPLKTTETLTHYLFKNNLKKKAEIVKSSKNAQLATLTYQVKGKNKFGYLLEIKPETGRFHQIRAQLAHIGLPIIGDEKYGSPEKYLPLSICLHAWKLNYRDQKTNQLNQFEAALPHHHFWNF